MYDEWRPHPHNIQPEYTVYVARERERERERERDILDKMKH